MNPRLYAKGADVTAWRSAEDFIASYHQALIDRAASDLGSSSEAVLLDAAASIETAIASHRHLLERLEGMIEGLSTAAPSADLAPINGISALTKSISAEESQKTTSNLLKELTLSFYGDLYRHFDTFHSAPVFYQMSMAFLSRVCSAIIDREVKQLGPAAAGLPEMSLIAVGSAGRAEYSPFSRLQLLLVHGNAAETHSSSIDLLCQALHAGLEAAGLAVDPVVSPRNREWRGTMTEWQQRCKKGIRNKAGEEMQTMYLLADQYPLCSAGLLAREFKETGSTALRSNRTALATLIARMAAHSNGLSIMGRLKLERSGSDRGLFRLVENGLQPLSAALSTLALVKKFDAAGNCERIHGLLRQGELDVELAERMLGAWHTLHGLRLLREQTFRIGEPTNEAACLDPDKLTAEQLHSLKEALESVAIIQRNVEIIFSGMGE